MKINLNSLDLKSLGFDLNFSNINNSNEKLEELIESTEDKDMYDLIDFFGSIKISVLNPTDEDFLNFMNDDNEKYFAICNSKELYKSKKHGIIGIDYSYGEPRFGFIDYEVYYGLSNDTSKASFTTLLGRCLQKTSNINEENK
jgi:hypothetical protein